MQVAQDGYLTPPQIAKQLHVDPAKILRWIGRGELAGINVAEKLGGRPRWRISRENLDSFLAGRTNRPATTGKPRRRQRQAVGFVKYF
jgi:excisionase family DNA binding protein